MRNNKVPVRYRPNAARSKVNDHLGTPPLALDRGPAPLSYVDQPEKYGRQGPSMVGHLRDSLLETSLAIRSSQGGAGTQTINFSHLKQVMEEGTRSP